MSWVKDKLGLAPRLRDALDSGSGEPQAVFTITGTIDNTDTTAKVLGTIPEDAVLVGIWLDVTTAFDSSGSDDVQVGDGSTDNHYGSADVSATGQTLTGWTNLGAVSNRDFTAKYVDGGGDSTTGAARVTGVFLAS